MLFIKEPHLPQRNICAKYCLKLDMGIALSEGLYRWVSGKESICQSRRWEFDPWMGKITWRTKGQPIQVFLPGNPMDRGAWQTTVRRVIIRQDWATERTHIALWVYGINLILLIIGPDVIRLSLLLILERNVAYLHYLE